MIWLQWPFSGFWVIGLFVGIDMLFSGWTWIMLALQLRNLPGARPATPVSTRITGTSHRVLFIDSHGRHCLLELVDRLRRNFGADQIQRLKALDVLERIEPRVSNFSPAECQNL